MSFGLYRQSRPLSKGGGFLPGQPPRWTTARRWGTISQNDRKWGSAVRSLKKLLGAALLGALLLALAAPALAAEEEFVLKGSALTGYNGPGGHVVIPDGVRRIGDFVFWGDRKSVV